MANTDQLKNILSNYVNQITDDLVLARAQLALDDYIAAYQAYQNIIQSAASSYSNLAGSVTKRTIDDARDARDRAWDEFYNLCSLGGVTVPSVDQSVAYWDLSGYGD